MRYVMTKYVRKQSKKEILEENIFEAEDTMTLVKKVDELIKKILEETEIVNVTISTGKYGLVNKIKYFNSEDFTITKIVLRLEE